MPIMRIEKRLQDLEAHAADWEESSVPDVLLPDEE